MYVAEVVLLTVAGDQAPEIPLFDVPANTGAVVPAQNGATLLNIGVTFGVTVTVACTVEAHSPEAGVNVYVPVVELFTVAGDHVPAIELFDVPGNAGAVAP